MNTTPTPDHDEEDVVGRVLLTESDGVIVAAHLESAVVSQGETEAEALGNLAEALELHERPTTEGGDEDLEPATAPWL